LDAGAKLVVNVDCSRPFAGPRVSRQIDSLVTEFRIDGGQFPDDSTVAIPWCGPFDVGDAGTEWSGGFLASANFDVIKISAWHASLYFASPTVSDPQKAALSNHAGQIEIPVRVGPFKTRPWGLGMVSDGGVAEPPSRCLMTPVNTMARLRIPRNWRYFWKPIGAESWVYCGPIDQ